MPREVLAARGQAGALQRLDDRHAERATPSRASEASARSPMAVFFALVNMSSTGAKSSVTPTASSSAASAVAKRRASAASPPRPSVTIGGHSVNGALEARDPSAFLIDADPRRQRSRRSSRACDATSATCAGSSTLRAKKMMPPSENSRASDAHLHGHWSARRIRP